MGGCLCTYAAAALMFINGFTFSPQSLAWSPSKRSQARSEADAAVEGMMQIVANSAAVTSRQKITRQMDNNFSEVHAGRRGLSPAIALSTAMFFRHEHVKLGHTSEWSINHSHRQTGCIDRMEDIQRVRNTISGMDAVTSGKVNDAARMLKDAVTAEKPPEEISSARYYDNRWNEAVMPRRRDMIEDREYDIDRRT